MYYTIFKEHEECKSLYTHLKKKVLSKEKESVCMGLTYLYVLFIPV